MTSLANEPLPNIRRIVPEVSLEMAECLNLMLDKNPANRPADGIKAAQLLQAILGQARDLDTLLAEAFRDDPRVVWSREGGQRFRLVVQLPDGRRQIVYVEPSAHGSAERLLLIYSTCCAAQPAYYEAALRLNSEMPHGSVAIREIGGRAEVRRGRHVSSLDRGCRRNPPQHARSRQPRRRHRKTAHRPGPRVTVASSTSGNRARR